MTSKSPVVQGEQVRPAAALPWKRDAYGGVYSGDSTRNRVVLTGFAIATGRLGDEIIQNADYVFHACNAYPRLVSMLRLMLSPALKGMDSEARKLLRELGELE